MAAAFSRARPPRIVRSTVETHGRTPAPKVTLKTAPSGAALKAISQKGSQLQARTGAHGYLLTPITSTSVLTMADDKIELALRRMVDELRELIEEQAREALADALGRRKATPARNPPGRPKASGRPVPVATPKPARAAKTGNGKRVRRTAADIEAVQGDIIKFLKKNPSSTSEQIQSGLGLPKEELQRPLSLLREEKKVKTVGERRGMKYSAR